MANNVINKQLLVYHNSIEDQMLTHNHQLTLKSWNNIINVLKTQANVNADYIKKLHRWLFGDGTGEARVPGTQGFVEYVLSYNGEHGWNALSQKNPERFSSYTADSDGNQIMTPIVATVQEHGNPDATAYELENTLAMRDGFGCLRGFTRDSNDIIYGSLEEDDELELTYINMSYFRARWDELFGENYLEAYDTIKEIGDAIALAGENIEGVKLLISKEITKVNNDVAEEITSLNIKGGIGTDSTQQINAVAEGVNSIAVNQGLAYGENSSSEGVAKITKNDDTYDFSVTYTLSDNSTTDELIFESVTDTSDSDESIETTPTTYIDNTKRLWVSSINLNTTGAKGVNSHSEGYHNLSDGPNVHTEGSTNYGTKHNAHVEGDVNYVDAISGHAEGGHNVLKAQNGHVEGMGNAVLGKGSHAENYANRIDGVNGHVEGVANIIRAGASHGEGYHNAILKGANSSHVEGQDNIINEGHYNSHVGGLGNKTSAPNQTIVGTYNEDDSEALFIVGCGKKENDIVSRSNAFEVLKDGRAKVYGAPTEDNDVVRLQELNTKLTKITITSDNVRVYTINPDGTNSNKAVVGTRAEASTIVMRDGGGRVYTETPTSNKHAANKQYVDELVGNIQTLLEAI